jgi:phenylacetate-CoA ligase
MGRADQLTKVKGMFVHPSQVQKVMDSHPEIARARLLVERPQDQDVMTLEVELKQQAQEGLIPAIEQSVREVFKLRGSVRIFEPGKLPDDGKMIEDLRKWD